ITECRLAEPRMEKFTNEHSEARVTTSEKVVRRTGAAVWLIALDIRCCTLFMDGSAGGGVVGMRGEGVFCHFFCWFFAILVFGFSRLNMTANISWNILRWTF